MLELINSDALYIPLKDKSVQCVVTSPPFYGLRDYGIEGQIGLEQSPEEYVAKLVEVFREVRRVLRDDGTLWLNLGDSYNSNASNQQYYNGCHGSEAGMGRYNKQWDGLKPKDLLGVPWRVAFALQADGWWLRSDIVWAKPNPMPESVRDRPTKAHEYLFLFAKSQTYYYDNEAIREEAAMNRWGGSKPANPANCKGDQPRGLLRDRDMQPAHRNKRSVWTISTKPYPGAHFATYPPALVEPCILAGTSEKGCCPICGKPWKRIVDRIPLPRNDKREHSTESQRMGKMPAPEPVIGGNTSPIVTTIGWQPTCTHDDEPIPCLVFDPFVGSGTTLLVARQLGRSGIGIDLSYTYLHDQATKRLSLDKLRAWSR